MLKIQQCLSRRILFKDKVPFFMLDGRECSHETPKLQMLDDGLHIVNFSKGMGF